VSAASVIFALFGTAFQAQEATPVFRATSELVLVDVQVLHKKTRSPAASVKAKDLLVFEEGVRQQVLHFSRDEFPLSVVFLFDLTDSVRGVLRRLADSAASVLAHFKPEDELSVMVYAGNARLVDGFTKNRERTRQAIERAVPMKYDEPAHFNEAVFQAAMQLKNSASPQNRRVIIWLTDNLPNVPYRQEYHAHTEIEALRALNEEAVVVAPILLKSPAWAVFAPMVGAFELPHRKAYPPGDAHKYAEETGGEAIGLRGNRPEERVAELIDELRARYTVGYRPSEEQPPGTFRKIEVKLAPDGPLRVKEWTVLARRGYYRK
jgi:VWFA-related protein